MFLPFIVDFYFNRSYYAYMVGDHVQDSRRNCRLLLASVSEDFVCRATSISERRLARPAFRRKRCAILKPDADQPSKRCLRTLKALDDLQGIEMLAPEITVDPLALLHNPNRRSVSAVTKARKGGTVKHVHVIEVRVWGTASWCGSTRSETWVLRFCV